MSYLGPEHLDSQCQEELLITASTSKVAEKSCTSEDSFIPADQSVTLNELREADIQRLKLILGKGQISDEELAADNFQHPKKYSEIKAFMQQHQEDLFNFDRLDQYAMWINLIKNEAEPEKSHFNCLLCNKKWEVYGMHQMRTDLAKDRGVLKRNSIENMDKLRRHSLDQSHKDIRDIWLNEQKAKNLHKLFSTSKAYEPTYLRVTNRNFRTAYIMAANDISFRTYPDLRRLQIINGNHMGRYCKTRSTANSMVQVHYNPNITRVDLANNPGLAKQLLLTILLMLFSEEPSYFKIQLPSENLFQTLQIMGKMDMDDFMRSFAASDSPWSLICDGSSDSADLHIFACLVQYIGIFKKVLTTCSVCLMIFFYTLASILLLHLNKQA